MSLIEVGTQHLIDGSINFREPRRDELVELNENAETTLLRDYAERTHQSLEILRNPNTGWIADKITWSPEYAQEAINGDLTHARIATQTSPTNIGLDFLNRQAAVALNLMSQAQADELDRRSLQTLRAADKINGLFANWYDSSNGQLLTQWPEQNDFGTNDEIKPFCSTVDNGILKLCLYATAENQKERNPELAECAEYIAKDIDLSRLYDPCGEPPELHPGQLHGGAYGDIENQTLQPTDWHYGLLTEARLATYAGILDGNLPPEHYFKIHRTLPATDENQRQKPKGETTIYSVNGQNIDVFEGHYEYQNGRLIPIVPTYDGSAFEEFFPGMIVPEFEWGEKSWRKNYKNYLEAMIDHKTGDYWGVSPATNPDVFKHGFYGYDTWGIPTLATHKQENTNSGYPRDNAITPHAAFLPIEYATEAVIKNTTKIKEEHPNIYGKYGFFDSLNPRNGNVAYNILSLNNSMLFGSVANHLTSEDGGCIRKPLRSRLEKTVKPLIEQEQFSIS